MKKDNEYVQETGTEDIVMAKDGENTERNAPAQASAVLGKFKDVDALAKAYGCLQAEFTRRSQMLKQLQKEMDNLKAEKVESTQNTGVEKLRKNAAARRAEEEKFDAYIHGLEQASVRADESEIELHDQQPQPIEGVSESMETGTLQENAQRDIAVSDDVKNVAPLQPSRGMTALSDDELFDKVMQNEGVRLKIVGSYLSSLTKSGAPLLTGGTGALAAPQQKAKNFSEAGNMALHMFRKSTQQA
ncbi:MAG: hypothetical protein J6A63_09095 [Clostridia bacterium]|nr:hypothetical protein [Clostridia bacterium]